MALEPSTSSESGSLYERLGGWGGIAVVVEFWCDRALADPQLAPHYARADLTTLRKEQAEFLVHLAGGPVRAPAQPLPPLLAAAPNSDWHFERVLGHLIAALIWANVPRQVIEDVLEVFSPLAPQIRPARPPEQGPPERT